MIALKLALAFLAGNRQKSGNEMRHTDHAQSCSARGGPKARPSQNSHTIGLQMQMQGRLCLPVRIRGFGERFRVLEGKKKGNNLERVTKLPVISI